MKISTLVSPPVGLVLVCIVALGLHLFAINNLNIVEDESAYIHDAAQIRLNFLPFRDFGGTKGPLFLFGLKLWQLTFENTLTVNRLFSATAHIVSIPILYVLARNLSSSSKLVGFTAAVFWAVTPVVVSLSSNTIHIPLELVFILASAAFLSRTRYTTTFTIVAGTLFFLAILTRASAIAFAPVLLLLLYFQTRSWRQFGVFALTGLGWLLVTLAIVFPLYGWPKTAFFLNADAVLIANSQRAVYAAGSPTIGLVESYFRFALPAWREGLAIMLAAGLLPFIWLAQRWSRVGALILFGLVSFSLAPLLLADIRSWWPPGSFEALWITNRATVLLFVALGIVSVYWAHRFPRIQGRVLLIVGVWVGAFLAFYKGWGRSPTPYYILESLPALSLAAAIVLTTLWRGLQFLPKSVYLLVFVVAVGVIGLGILLPYPELGVRQYRGTLEINAVEAMVGHIRETVPESAPLFTGQPIFASLSGRPLYGGYTHPGWYLSERAGYLPAEIRSVFLPDFDTLHEQVAAEIDWIVVDWRTNDIFFKEGTPDTAPFRQLLADDFTAVVTVPNETSADITLYRRTRDR